MLRPYSYYLSGFQACKRAAVVTYGPFVANLDHAERRARCRALRALGVVLLGQAHPLLPILAAAEADDAALEVAQRMVDELAPLPRRRLLASYLRVSK
jgi:hypothetical protein